MPHHAKCAPRRALGMARHLSNLPSPQARRTGLQARRTGLQARWTDLQARGGSKDLQCPGYTRGISDVKAARMPGSQSARAC